MVSIVKYVINAIIYERSKKGDILPFNVAVSVAGTPVLLLGVPLGGDIPGLQSLSFDKPHEYKTLIRFQDCA